MRRTFTCLLIVILLVCGKQGYDLLTAGDQIKSFHSGSLSDIAEEVIAIPLQDSGEFVIKDARNIRQEGNNLFLVSNEILYRFNRKGEFICQITCPEQIRVAGYVVNPANQQLIVLGNTDDIFYYSFDGDLLSRKKLKSDLPGQQMLSISMHDNRILTTEEHINKDSAARTSCIEKRVVEYDSSFHQIKTHRISQVNLERSDCPFGCFSPLVSIDKDSGSLYVYGPSMQPENLLRDTLYLRQKRQSQALAKLVDTDALALLPVRIGSRFWISSYYNAEDVSNNYMFCYDTELEQYWQVKDGLKDNFYHTGTVRELEAMDLYSQSYCFCRSGQALKKAFPDKANEESLVLFIIKLKA